MGAGELEGFDPPLRWLAGEMGKVDRERGKERGSVLRAGGYRVCRLDPGSSLGGAAMRISVSLIEKDEDKDAPPTADPPYFSPR